MFFCNLNDVSLIKDVIDGTYRLLCKSLVPVPGCVSGRADRSQLALTGQDRLPQARNRALVLVQLGEGGLQLGAGGLHLLAQRHQLLGDGSTKLLDVLLFCHLFS